MSADSFELVLNEWTRNIRDINDTLALIGIYYLGKSFIKLTYNLCKSFKTYILPQIVCKETWLKSLGEWAIITSINNEIGVSLAEKLANLRINLILVDEDKDLLESFSQHLVLRYEVQAIRVNMSWQDLSSLDSLAQIVNENNVGILVNSNVNMLKSSYLHSQHGQDIQKALNTNVVLLTRLINMVLPKMIEKNQGAIIGFSSYESFLPAPFNSANVASNLYTEKLLEALSYEYKQTGIEFICMKSFQLEPKLNSLIKRSKKIAAENETGFQVVTHLNQSSFASFLLALKYFLVTSFIPKPLLNWTYSNLIRTAFFSTI